MSRRRDDAAAALREAKAAGDAVAYDALLLRTADNWEVPVRADGTGHERVLDAIARRRLQDDLRSRGFDLG